MNSGMAVRRVGEVVDGVGQQRHRTGHQDDQHLEQGSHHQRGEGDLHRPQPSFTRLQRRIQAVGGVVAVRTEDLSDRVVQPRRMDVLMTTVTVLMAAAMPMTMAGVALVVAHDARSAVFV